MSPLPEQHTLDPELLEELQRLRAIEYHAWKLLDEASEDGGFFIFSAHRRDYRRLNELLPRQCPMPPNRPAQGDTQ